MSHSFDHAGAGSGVVRTPTPIDAIAESWVVTLTELDPALATSIGLPGEHSGFADYSPEGQQQLAEASRAVLKRLEAAVVVDEVDAVTQSDLVSSLRLDGEADAAKLWMRDLNNVASPAQDIRGILDLMPTGSHDDWATIAQRLNNVPGAIDGYISALSYGIEHGVVPARRQVAEVIAQAQQISAPGGFFDDFISPARAMADDALIGALAAAASVAAQSYERLEKFLRTELAPRAATTDACGRDIYALHSRRFLGATIDLDETYEWGIDELARMTREQEAIAREILPGANIAEAIEFLDADPARTLHGTEALQQWMQKLSDEAVAALAGTHFDIAGPMRTLECKIAPTHDGVIYYTGPSDDFSRPGRMWWSVPESVTDFTTWRETTTVYHEGVPGHHLQIAQAVINRDQLNTYRRQLSGTSGHAEG
ncbi:MAG: DUF885 domain-containing protein, partial [Rhodoglobus sp.]